MLSWFLNLTPAEKGAALAVVDDPVFLRFYLQLLRNDQHSRARDANHLRKLLSKEDLINKYSKAQHAITNGRVGVSLANYENETVSVENDAADVNNSNCGIIAEGVDHAVSPHLGRVSQISDAILDEEVVLASSHGGGAFDSIFLSKHLLLCDSRSSSLLELFDTLSHGKMFSKEPLFEDVTAAVKGKIFPEVSWLADFYPISHHLILLSRIELAAWNAFYTCKGAISRRIGVVSSSNSSSRTSDCGTEEELAVVKSEQAGSSSGSSTTTHYSSLSDAVRTSRGVETVNEPIVTTAAGAGRGILDEEEANERENLSIFPAMPLDSALASLPVYSVMFTLTCLVEEIRSLWSLLSNEKKDSVLDLVPAAKSHRIDLIRRGLPEELICDKIVLCPQRWVEKDSGSAVSNALVSLQGFKSSSSFPVCGGEDYDAYELSRSIVQLLPGYSTTQDSSKIDDAVQEQLDASTAKTYVEDASFTSSEMANRPDDLCAETAIVATPSHADSVDMACNNESDKAEGLTEELQAVSNIIASYSNNNNKNIMSSRSNIAKTVNMQLFYESNRVYSSVSELVQLLSEDSQKVKKSVGGPSSEPAAARTTNLMRSQKVEPGTSVSVVGPVATQPVHSAESPRSATPGATNGNAKASTLSTASVAENNISINTVSTDKSPRGATAGVSTSNVLQPKKTPTVLQTDEDRMRSLIFQDISSFSRPVLELPSISLVSSYLRFSDPQISAIASRAASGCDVGTDAGTKPTMPIESAEPVSQPASSANTPSRKKKKNKSKKKKRPSQTADVGVDVDAGEPNVAGVGSDADDEEGVAERLERHGGDSVKEERAAVPIIEGVEAMGKEDASARFVSGIGASEGMTLSVSVSPSILPPLHRQSYGREGVPAASEAVDQDCDDSESGRQLIDQPAVDALSTRSSTSVWGPTESISSLEPEAETDYVVVHRKSNRRERGERGALSSSSTAAVANAPAILSGSLPIMSSQDLPSSASASTLKASEHPRASVDVTPSTGAGGTKGRGTGVSGQVKGAQRSTSTHGTPHTPQSVAVGLRHSQGQAGSQSGGNINDTSGGANNNGIAGQKNVRSPGRIKSGAVAADSKDGDVPDKSRPDIRHPSSPGSTATAATNIVAIVVASRSCEPGSSLISTETLEQQPQKRQQQRKQQRQQQHHEQQQQQGVVAVAGRVTPSPSSTPPDCTISPLNSQAPISLSNTVANSTGGIDIVGAEEHLPNVHSSEDITVSTGGVGEMEPDEKSGFNHAEGQGVPGHSMHPPISYPYVNSTDATAISGRNTTMSSAFRPKQLHEYLTQSVIKFVKTMSDRLVVFKMTQAAVLFEVTSLVHALWPHAVVRPYGSSITGLALPSSDIDIVIQLAPHDNESVSNPKSELPTSISSIAANQSLSQRNVNNNDSLIWSDDNGIANGNVNASVSDYLAPVDQQSNNRLSLSSLASPATLHQQNREDVHTHQEKPISDRESDEISINDGSVASGHVQQIIEEDRGQSVLTPTPDPTQDEVVRGLFALSAQLALRSWVSDVNPIPTAFIPVIKLKATADVLLQPLPMRQMVSQCIAQEKMAIAYQQQQQQQQQEQRWVTQAPHQQQQQRHEEESDRYNISNNTDLTAYNPTPTAHLISTATTTAVEMVNPFALTPEVNNIGLGSSASASTSSVAVSAVPVSGPINLPSLASSMPPGVPLISPSSPYPAARMTNGHALLTGLSAFLQAQACVDHSYNSSDSDVAFYDPPLRTDESSETVLNEAGGLSNSCHSTSMPPSPNSRSPVLSSLWKPIYNPNIVARLQMSPPSAYVAVPSMSPLTPIAPPLPISPAVPSLQPPSLPLTRSGSMASIDSALNVNVSGGGNGEAFLEKSQAPNSDAAVLESSSASYLYPAPAGGFASPIPPAHPSYLPYPPPPVHVPGHAVLSMPIANQPYLLPTPSTSPASQLVPGFPMPIPPAFARGPAPLPMHIGMYPPPPPFPSMSPLPLAPASAATIFSPLPFHEAQGVVIPVDITIEAGEHKGISTCEYIQSAITARSPVITSVVKAVKAVLQSANMNVAFSGGLSSYSVFLLVCAAYDIMTDSNHKHAPSSLSSPSSHAHTMTTRRANEAASSSAAVSEVAGDGARAADISHEVAATDIPHIITNDRAFLLKCDCGVEGSGESDRTCAHEDRLTATASGAESITDEVTEGTLLLFFLDFFGSRFNRATHGVQLDDEAASNGGVIFELSAEQRTTIGTSAWVTDPLDVSKNVARPSFHFSQIQALFARLIGVLQMEYGQYIRSTLSSLAVSQTTDHSHQQKPSTSGGKKPKIQATGSSVSGAYFGNVVDREGGYHYYHDGVGGNHAPVLSASYSYNGQLSTTSKRTSRNSNNRHNAGHSSHFHDHEWKEERDSEAGGPQSPPRAWQRRRSATTDDTLDDTLGRAPYMVHPSGASLSSGVHPPYPYPYNHPNHPHPTLAPGGVMYHDQARGLVYTPTGPPHLGEDLSILGVGMSHGSDTKPSGKARNSYSKHSSSLYASAASSKSTSDLTTAAYRSDGLYPTAQASANPSMAAAMSALRQHAAPDPSLGDTHQAPSYFQTTGRGGGRGSHKFFNAINSSRYHPYQQQHQHQHQQYYSTLQSLAYSNTAPQNVAAEPDLLRSLFQY